MISAILFDLGGTLIEESSDDLNTKRGYYEIQVRAIHQSLKKDGVSVDWSSFRDKYEQVRNKQRERSEKTLREYDMRKRVEGVLRFFNYGIFFTSDVVRRAVDAYMDVYVNSLRIHQSTHGLLRKLSAEYELGLVTNFAYYPGAYQILDRFTLRSFFKAIVVSGEVGWKKPSRRIFESALYQMSVKPEEAVFVGDDYRADIVGAKKVGMKTTFICENPPSAEKADITIRSLEEIPSAIKHLSQCRT